MPIIADYHMHTPRCRHAAGPMEAYIEHGLACGLSEIGFADHNPLPHGYGANVRMAESELDDYVADVLHLRDRYLAHATTARHLQSADHDWKIVEDDVKEGGP